jgi:hypothetical protein
MNEHLCNLFLGALLYAPEKIKVPWYKNKRTIGELSLLICLCIAGIIIGAVLGSRRSPPPPSMYYQYCRCSFLSIIGDHEIVIIYNFCSMSYSNYWN